MDATEFAQQYPRLFHVALSRNARLIARRGLQSTSTLFNLADPSQASRRRSLEAAHRSSVAELLLADGTKAYLRNDPPVTDKQLRRVLEPGTTLEDWYRLLNGRLFFWLSLNSALEFAAGYEDQDQVLYALDTARLLAAHGPRVAVSAINCGTTRGNAPRGASTFVRLEAVPAGAKLVELTVEGEVPDATALCLERWTIVEGTNVSKLE